jgi:AcrR family transcriptional regulator
MAARDRILDAAVHVMREHGIVRATTKEIAREAGCSEALIYKHFTGKQELFVAVLQERLPRPFARANPGEGTVEENLVLAVAALVAFFREGFPIAAALFGERDVLATWRKQVTERGGGPSAPRRALEAYLAAEQELGRLPTGLDPVTVASLLAGAALQEAFLAAFDDRPVADADTLARRWLATLALLGENSQPAESSTQSSKTASAD